MDTTRVLVYSRQETPLFEIAPGDVFELRYTEELNGQRALTITTTQPLEKGWRILTVDGTGKWREHVITGIDEAHQDMRALMGTYSGVWSLQSDLCGVICDTMPGVRTDGGVSAAVALESLLTHTSRWGVGTVTSGTRAGASFYNMSAWEALGVLSETWKCEVDAQITVGMDGVVSRDIALYEHMGSSDAVRRFDWSYDLIGIRRKVSDEPVYARIIPLGQGEQITDESGAISGYGRRITIEDVNNGVKWLQNNEVANYLRLPDGNGGWEYPTRNVVFDQIQDKQVLKDTALASINDYTVPHVTYTADVMQLAAAGMDPKGVALGDEVQCVDKGFGKDGIRVSGRVVRMVVNGLDPSDIKLTIGEVSSEISNYFASIQKNFAQTQESLRQIGSSATTTAQYLTNIIDNLNHEINATGGFWYITQGQGVRTYDTEVTDPLIGEEANAVTEMRGGTLRFANSRTAQGEWDWKTVIVSGHISADLITAANITSGFIGSPSGNYWNLDTGELRMSTSAMVGDKTLAEYVEEHAAEADLSQAAVFNALTNNGAAQGMFIQNGQLYVNASYLRTGIIADAAGKNYWNMQTGEFSLSSTTEIGDTTAGSIVSSVQTAQTTATNAQTAATTAQTAAANAATKADNALAEAKSEIGGTNLLLDTNLGSMTKKAATANRYWSSNTDATNSFVKLAAAQRPVGGVEYARQMAFKAKNQAYISGECYYNKKNVQMMDGQKYTVSCWARTTQGSGRIKFQYGQTLFKSSSWLNITSKWKRYSWTFEFKQANAGGSGGARMYFYGQPRTEAACTVQMCGMKIETGSKATDWSAASEDTNFGITNATALAKTYTNAISKSDRDYTAQQRTALDNSFNQSKVFKRLTNNGRAQGIVLKNGQLYINASYINAGTVNAGIIKTGILSDKKGWNKWNLATGFLSTANAELKNCNVVGTLDSGSSNHVQFNNGTVRFYNGTKNALTIDGALQFIDGRYGAHITYDKYLVLRGPKLAVDDRTNGSGINGATGSIKICIPTAPGAYAKTSTRYEGNPNAGTWNAAQPKWIWLTINVLNGLITTIDLAG